MPTTVTQRLPASTTLNPGQRNAKKNEYEAFARGLEKLYISELAVLYAQEHQIGNAVLHYEYARRRGLMEHPQAAGNPLRGRPTLPPVHDLTEWKKKMVLRAEGVRPSRSVSAPPRSKTSSVNPRL